MKKCTHPGIIPLKKCTHPGKAWWHLYSSQPFPGTVVEVKEISLGLEQTYRWRFEKVSGFADEVESLKQETTSVEGIKNEWGNETEVSFGNGIVCICNPEVEISRVLLYDINGRVIGDSGKSQRAHIINLKTDFSGCCIVAAQLEDGSSIRRKVMIK